MPVQLFLRIEINFLPTCHPGRCRGIYAPNICSGFLHLLTLGRNDTLSVAAVPPKEEARVQCFPCRGEHRSSAYAVIARSAATWQAPVVSGILRGFPRQCVHWLGMTEKATGATLAPSLRADFPASGENVREADKRGAGPAGLLSVSEAGGVKLPPSKIKDFCHLPQRRRQGCSAFLAGAILAVARHRCLPPSASMLCKPRIWLP